MNVPAIVSNVTKWVTRHSPEILTGMAVAGVVTTGVFAAKGAVNLDTEVRLKNVTDRKKRFKLSLKHYAPAIGSAALTITSIIAARHIQADRYAAVLGLYSGAETTIAKYQEKLTEAVGHEQAMAVRQEIAKEVREEQKASVTDTEGGGYKTYISANNEYRFEDLITRQTFVTNVIVLRRIENIVNHQINVYNCLSLTEVFDVINDEIGATKGNRLKPSILTDGLYFDVDHPLEFFFDASTPDRDTGELLVPLNYIYVPKEEYNWNKV